MLGFECRAAREVVRHTRNGERHPVELGERGSEELDSRDTAFECRRPVAAVARGVVGDYASGTGPKTAPPPAPAKRTNTSRRPADIRSATRSPAAPADSARMRAARDPSASVRHARLASSKVPDAASIVRPKPMGSGRPLLPAADSRAVCRRARILHLDEERSAAVGAGSAMVTAGAPSGSTSRSGAHFAATARFSAGGTAMTGFRPARRRK